MEYIKLFDQTLELQASVSYMPCIWSLEAFTKRFHYKFNLRFAEEYENLITH